MALSSKDKAAVKKAAEAGGLKNVKVSSSGKVSSSNSATNTGVNPQTNEPVVQTPAPAPAPAPTPAPAATTNKSTLSIITDPATGQQFARDTAVAGSTYAPYASGASGATNSGTISIITDPATGQKFSRDTSIPGSTYQPYTGNANTPAPVTPAVPVVPPVVPGVVPPTIPGVTPPVAAPAAGATGTEDVVPVINTNLGLGSTGAEVIALQNYLQKLGYSIPSLKSGAAKPGLYGAETQAAVTQWQKDQEAKGLMKVPDASQYGSFGPLSRQALAASAAASAAETPVDQPLTEEPVSELDATVEALRAAYGLPPSDLDKSPVEQAMDDYKQIYESLGVPSIKQSYTEAVDEFTKIQNELNDKINDIRDDPWLSQGVADGRVQAIERRYEGKISIATSKMQLFDSLVKEGIAQAKDIMGQVNQIQNDREQVVNEAIDIMQKKQDALNDLETEIVEVAGRKVLIDSKTGETIKDLGVAKLAGSGSGGSSSKGTESERKQDTVSQVGQLFDGSYTIPDSGGVPYVDSSGFATPQGWKTAMNASGLSRKDFITEFGHLLYIEKGKVSPAYGLTPAEQKILGVE